MGMPRILGAHRTPLGDVLWESAVHGTPLGDHWVTLPRILRIG